MRAFSALYDVLEHIKNVEAEAIELSKSANLKITAFLENNKIEIDDSVLDALQYQDIISQQLSATIEAISYVESHLKMFEATFESDESLANESINKLHKKLNKVLDKAKDRREAFSGKVHEDSEDEIEFF